MAKKSIQQPQNNFKHHRKKDGFEGQRAIVIPRSILQTQCAAHPILLHQHITDIGYYPKALFHYRERPRGAEQHILIYCVEGYGKVKLQEIELEIGPSDFVLLPAGVAHTYTANEELPWTIYWVHFRGKLADELVNMIWQKHKNLTGHAEYRESRINLFEEIYRNLENGYEIDNLGYASLCLMHYVSSFLFEERFSTIDNRERDDTISKSIEFMRQNIHRVITLTEIAETVNLSAAHYSSLFRKKTGFRPIEYLNHLKAQKACQFLLFTDMRVKEIADRLGLEDPYYFTRMFTKIMGVSPSEYRNKRQA